MVLLSQYSKENERFLLPRVSWSWSVSAHRKCLYVSTHFGHWCWHPEPWTASDSVWAQSGGGSDSQMSWELLSGAAPSPFLNMSLASTALLLHLETLIMLPAPLWETRLWVSSYCCVLLLLNSVLWINKAQWLHFLHLGSQYFKWLSQRTCWFVGAFQAVAENNFCRNECEKRTELLVVLKEYWDWLVLNHWKKCFLPLVIKL